MNTYKLYYAHIALYGRILIVRCPDFRGKYTYLGQPNMPCYDVHMYMHIHTGKDTFKEAGV